MVSRTDRAESIKVQNCTFSLQIFPHMIQLTLWIRDISIFQTHLLYLLSKSLQTELYNDTYFPSNSKYITKPSFDQPSCQTDYSAFKLHDSEESLPPSSTLFEEFNTVQSTTEIIEIDDVITPC